ncbi:c-type cytochrome [Segetibacter koreensis]|uniref:c-type cytochrome n=1 Tax=Segetibacter koreensis TaxID=398037 RepID=UPI00035DC7FC|nr:cytochrome c [Segetibacter koreensis]
MKKIIITGILCLLVVAYIFAQAKKQPLAQASIKRGQKVFESTCIVCHQKNGGGVPRLNPPLIKTKYVLGDKSQLVQIVLKGLNQPIEIEGETYNNVMPSFAQLTDEQIADVLTYVRNSFGNKASAVTPALVKAERAKTQ